jgi:hypothetical protein
MNCAATTRTPSARIASTSLRVITIPVLLAEPTLSVEG